MKNVIKVACLSSIITAALVYVVLEWQPLAGSRPEPPAVSWASANPVATEAGYAAPAPATDAPLSEDEKNNIAVYERCGPGVVNITTRTMAYDFFLQPVPMEGGTGSGAILDKQGHIVTNYHVIENATDIEVTLADRSRHAAEVVGADRNNDVAVLKIDAPPERLTPIPLGSATGLKVGQKVLAIGNPYGLERTLTTGIISSLGRSIEASTGRIIDGIIQTDAAINPGNSGGPLLNSAGEIIGINTAILSGRGGGSIGIGFAIPVETVKRITDDLIALGYVRYPYLGISSRGALNLVDYPGLPEALNLDTDRGLLIMRLESDSPAARAGIRGGNQRVRVGNSIIPVGGDVILAFEGTEVASVTHLADMVEKYKPGDSVRLTILRDNRRMDVTVTLGELRVQ